MDKEKLKGFQPSDAALLLNYALTKEMSSTLIGRIGDIKSPVANSIAYVDQYSTAKDQLNKDYLYLYGGSVNKNTKHYHPHTYSNFTVSAHIDFTLDASIEGAPTWVKVIPAKKPNTSISKVDFNASVLNSHFPELAWHYMVMYKNDPNAKLLLKIMDNSGDFDALNFNDIEITSEMVMGDIMRIQEALAIIDKGWNKIPSYSIKVNKTA